MRRIVVEQDFVMMLHTQQQVDVLKSIHPNQRILRLDATGNLVKIPKKDREYNLILSYFIELKDLREILVNSVFIYLNFYFYTTVFNYLDNSHRASAIIFEMHSSRHDTYQIKEFYSVVKADVLRGSNCDFVKFRLI